MSGLLQTRPEIDELLHEAFAACPMQLQACDAYNNPEALFRSVAARLRLDVAE